jgi:hypothetical protein
MDEQKVGYALGWDSTIKDDGPEYLTFAKGRYPFKVVEFERARFAGSENLPACPQAIVHLEFTGKDKDSGKQGTVEVKHNLYLTTKTKGFLCAFFISIGLMKEGEEISMPWNKVVGSTGEAELFIDNWTDQKGNPRQNNKVEKFYPPTVF